MPRRGDYHQNPINQFVCRHNGDFSRRGSLMRRSRNCALRPPALGANGVLVQVRLMSQRRGVADFRWAVGLFGGGQPYRFMVAAGSFGGPFINRPRASYRDFVRR